ncbi:MAG: hypothetical protein AAGI25_16810 [Bacteroidota bacterium]
MIGCSSSQEPFKSETLEISRLTDSSYVHISYLKAQGFGRVSCNGLVYFNGKDSFVFDTPTTDAASTQLLNWIHQYKKAIVKAVIISHYHQDCLDGLITFHENIIPFYAKKLTVELAKEKNSLFLKTNSKIV